MFSPKIMRVIQVVLLIMIILGMTLLFTQKYWVDPLVNFIISKS
jgi:Co/Zn/Cd efflux system component